jgi:CelD/BcsL family acetyltransferase involved in cellulose biosynthesis
MRPLVGFRIEFLEGDGALRRARDPAFLAEWSALAALDPRNTVYQEPEFALAWWSATEGREAPILVLGRDESNTLIGLMALSRPLATRSIRHVGAHQAIYDGWIARPELQDEFAGRAVEEVFAQVQPRRWLWRYLPPGSPTTWAERRGATRAPLLGQISGLEVPMWDLSDAAFLDKRLKHKRLRNYANRYRKEGELVCERERDPERAAALVDRLVSWVDFRQGAVNATLPFRQDATKRDFYRRLAAGAQTRVTVLRLDDRPLAIQLDSYAKSDLCLCLHGYDPSEGQRSPGMLLLTSLAEQCVAEGLTRIDMTPGGDGWKRDFTNAHVEGHRVELFAVPEDAALEQGRDRLARHAADALRRFGAEPKRVRAEVQTARDIFSRLPRVLRGRLSGPRAVGLFELDLDPLSIPAAPPSARAATLEDLVEIDDQEPRPHTQRVLWDALKRYERGGRPFVYRGADSRVAVIAWQLDAPVTQLAPPPTARLPLEPEAPGAERVAATEVPPDVPVLVVSYESGLDRSPALALARPLRALLDAGVRRVWIAAGPDQHVTLDWLDGAARRIA